MKDNLLNVKIVNSVFWKLFERIGTQGIQFVVSIILARILCPSDYGYVSMLLVFTSIANIVIQQGFSSSLIQKKDIDDSDFVSGYVLSLIIAVVCYGILFLLSPIIANFYEMPLLSSQLRVISIILFFGGSSSIMEAKLRRDFHFKKIFICSLIAILFSGTSGILSAYYGLGSWALVIQQVINYFVYAICLLFVTKFNFKAHFSLQKAKVLFSFGWKVLGASLIDAFYREIYNLTIGKVYSSETLGNYNKAEQFPKLIAVNVDGAISSVMLPAFSKRQDDKEKLKQMLRRTLLTSTFLIFPMMFGLAAVSKSAVLVLLTDKWLGCVPYMELLCISYIFYPFYSANNQAIQGIGRSDYCLKIEFIKRIIGIIILIITLPFGVLVMVEGQIGYAIISSFIHAYPNKKLIGYGYFSQVKDIIPNLIISLIMGICVYLFNFIDFNIYLKLISQILTGMIVYILLAKLFKAESYEYILNLVKDKVKGKKNEK